MYSEMVFISKVGMLTTRWLQCHSIIGSWVYNSGTQKYA